MGLADSSKNIGLDAIRAAISHVGANTADPGTTGANEVSGGSYARKAISFAAAASGQIAMSNAPVLDIPAGVTVTFLSFWSAVTGGTYRGSAPVTSAAFPQAGTALVQSGTISITG